MSPELVEQDDERQATVRCVRPAIQIADRGAFNEHLKIFPDFLVERVIGVAEPSIHSAVDARRIQFAVRKPEIENPFDIGTCHHRMVA